MSTASFIADLLREGMTLWVEDGELCFRALKGVLTPSLRQKLKACKMEMVTLLSANKKYSIASFTQQRLWFLDQLEGEGATVYLIPFALRLTGILNVPALHQALQEVVNRHEVLRTIFTSVDGEAVQVVTPTLELALPLIDLSGLLAEEREQEARRHAQENTRTGFDLCRGPLIRFGLLKLGAEEHVLLLNMHHIISDGWSLNVLVKEIVTLYAANIESRENPLPPLPIQYADYATWQRSRLTGDVLQEQIDYWQKQLAGLPPLLTLPADFPRPAAQTFVGRSHNFTLGVELTKRLNALSQKSGATLFMTLASAFAILLGRYSGQADLAMGTPIANRTHKEMESLIGFFVNTLVLRVDLEDNPRFTDLLERMKQTCLDAYAYQDVPFERLVEELKPERSLSYSPLFQVMFTLQNNPEFDFSLPDLRIGSLGIEHTVSKFDLTLNITEHEGILYSSFEYNTDLFQPEAIEWTANHFQTLLEGIVSNPEAAVSSLPLLSEVERKRVVVEFNQTQAEYPQERCIHQIFEEQVVRTPESIALVFEDQALIYEQLNCRANQMAHHLRGIGVGPETLVGICVERSLEMVIGLLGILKAGGAYVPMDPGYPPERLAFILEDSKAQILLTQSALSSSFTIHHSPFKIINLDADWKVITELPSHNPKTEVHPGNLAYVIYTSGSTGKPKGVMVQHAGLSNISKVTKKVLVINSSSRILQFASLSFDAATYELVQSLTAGASLHLSSHEKLLPGSILGKFINDQLITHITLPPTTLATMVADDLLSVTMIAVAGEVCSPSLALPWAGRKRMLNLYGPTETTVWATAYECIVDTILTAPILPVGHPVANTQTYILDGNGQPTPIGVAGELYIGGVQVARGYLNRPELTAEKFIPDLFSADPGARLYKTGDLARYLPNGNIEYLGRTDFQVKIRGFRVELGEIEAALTRHAGVREAIVLAREDNPGDKRLVVYWVPVGANTPPDIMELRTHLKAGLPEYMLPAAFVKLDALPLTPNGKVDRKALPAPEYQAAVESYVAPRTPTEQALTKIFSEVLGIERVSVKDNFFDLGGHSLLAVILLERMRQNGLHTDLKALFNAPTLAELAAVIGSQANIVEVPSNRIPSQCEAILPGMLPLVKLSQAEIDRIVETVPGGAVNVQDIYPLAPLQEGILFHHLLSTEGDAYLLSSLFAFDTRGRVENFLDALQKVVDRHDIFRTAVVWENLNEAVQVVWRRAPLVKEEVELDAQAGDAAEQLYQRFNLRNTRIDVHQAPMLRAYIAYDATLDRWLLLVLFHHLVGDHITMDVIQQEVRAHLAGQADRLPKPLPFRNFVIQARLGVSQEEHQEFFKQMLGDVDEPTATFGLLDAQGDSIGIEEAHLEVDADLARRLRERARALKVSAAGLCHLAWALVLARASGCTDVVFGTVLFGRMQGGEGADRVMGMFINTLPIRIKINEGSVETSVRRMHDLLIDLMRHEHASLALAQRCSGVQAPMPLFSALLNYRYSPGANQTSSVEDLKVWEGIERLRFEERTNYPIILSVDDQGQGFNLTVQIQRPIEPMRVCRLMHAALQRLVEALETTPETAVHSIDVLPESERRRIVEEWNATQAEYPRHKCFHELFEARVEQTPDEIAVVCLDEQVRYRELNRKVDNLARSLTEQNVAGDAVVGLLAERSILFLSAMLGIFKAGGAYVPLDPRHPVQRHVQVLEQSQTRWVLVTRPFLTPMQEVLDTLPPEKRPKILLIEELLESGDGRPQQPKAGRSRPGHLAYVIFTSGSTGTPKGAMVEQRGMINHLYAKIRDLKLTATDRIAQTASQCFDISVWQFLAALVTGGRVYIYPDEIAHDPAALLEHVEKDDISILETVPSLMQVMLDQVALLPAPQRPTLAALRWMIPTGEAMPPELCRRWLQHYPSIPLLNAYGPTECSDDVTHYPMPEPPAMQVMHTPIGRPIANMRIYILNDRLEPVPVGVVGELYVGGDGVGRGYLGRAELTAEQFIPDPFGGERGVRLYRTGDLGRWLPDGNIEFLGRIDYQVKIRGFRIELGEIETVLRQYPPVRDAVVLATEGSSGEKQLAAYVVAQQGATLQVEDLRDFLKTKLPDYMIPAGFVMLEALPLTPNGKLDRKALPAPGYQAPAETYIAPRTPTEQALAEIFSEVLGIERVGVNDSFFNLGGHSLLATQVVSRIRQVLGFELSLRQLFTTPVIVDLAVHIDKAGAPTPLIKIPIADRNVPLPLSFAQQRLWFIQQLDPNNSAYLIPMALRLTGRLDIAILEKSFNEIRHRHEALRTEFAEKDGQPVQIVLPAGRCTILVIDLRGIPGDTREEILRHIIEAEIWKPFDLSNGPPMRIVLLQLDSMEYILSLILHHIIFDAWSVEVLARELMTCYNAILNDQKPNLPALPVQYVDFAAWEQSWLQGPVLEKQLAYWKKQLDGIPPVIELPTDRPRPLVQSFQGARLPFTLSHKLSTTIKNFCRTENVTLFMFLLTAFQTLLYRYSGQSDIVISTGTGNRRWRETESLIGCFINMPLLRADFSQNLTFREQLKQTRQRSLEANEYQDFPFQKLVEILRPKRSTSYNPLTQVMFVLHNAPMAAVELKDLKINLYDIIIPAAQFDLLLRMGETGSLIGGCMEYNTDIFKATTIRRFLEHFEILLEGMVTNPDRSVSQLPFLTSAEQLQIVTEWNTTQKNYPQDRCLHELFEEQVKRNPQAVAVYQESKPLTYDDLNRCANRLAHYLRSFGVKPDIRVGICVERSFDMVVGLMGILKAGGAYVPLDPTYPKERLAYMVQDSQVQVLLTQQKIAEFFPHCPAPVICLDRSWDHQSIESEKNPNSAATAANLVYVIYTSGSTGRPKGVMLDHRGRLNNFYDFNQRFGVGPGDLLIALSSLSFDMCAYDVLGILAAGASIVLPTPVQERDSRAWAELMIKHQVTIWHSVPALLEMLVEQIETRPHLYPHALRLVLLGGDWIPVSLPDSLKAMIKDVQVVSLGGATEVSMDSTIYLIQESDPNWKSIPYGRPMTNQSAYVLDSHLQPVPVGVPGELHLGGIGVAWGYLGHPELTAEKFIPNPFATEAGDRIYKTGDLARYLPDGNLNLIGRKDFQVKIRGFRIELEEIAAALRRHPAVTETIVLFRKDKPDAPLLAAYIITKPGIVTTPGELRNFLKQNLPEYMIPAAFVFLEQWPLTPNGKVDRRAFPLPDVQPIPTKAVPVEPRNELEKRWAGIWSDILQIEKIGIDENFFELGGDSFKAIKLIQRSGEKISLLDFFLNPTIKGLSEFLTGQRQKTSGFLHRLSPSDSDDTLSLVCIPYGGGSAAIYQPLANILPKNIALYTIALPGHDLNRQEEELRPLDYMAKACLAEIRLKTNGPLALYGHCAGAALTIEIARLLEESGVKIQTIYIGGALPDSSRSWLYSALSTIIGRFRKNSPARLLNYLKYLGGFNDIQDPNELEFIMKSFAYDGQCAEQYFKNYFRDHPNGRLKAPIVCLVGDQDPLTTGYRKRYKRWKAFSGSIGLAVIEGGDHYFIKHKTIEVSRVITDPHGIIFSSDNRKLKKEQ